MALTFDCPNFVVPGGALDLVEGAWSAIDFEFSNAYNNANSQINEIKTALTKLDDFEITPELPVIGEVDLSGYLCNINLPTVDDGTWTHQDKPFNPDLKWDIENWTVTDEPSPSFNEGSWGLNIPDIPDINLPAEPGDAPAVGDTPVPDAPTVTNGDIIIPDPPSLRAITLPTAQDISLPVWDVEAPDDTGITAPTGQLNWIEEDYTSDLLDKTTGTISWMLDGGTGIPDAIWNMIWDRAREQLTEERDRAIEEATERWAARGFSVPGGALNKQIDEVIARFDQLSAEQLRETAIKQAQLEVENLRFAVESGIKLEGVLINLWNSIQDRALKAAMAVYEIAIALFNAKVTKYNADAQVFATRAQVHKTLIEAELSKLEIYKAELEGQKLIGEINQQDVQVYTARVDAMTKLIQIYVAQIEAVKAKVSVEKTKVDAYVAEVGAYGERVKAQVAIYDGYKTRIQGEAAKAEIYKAQVNAFTSRVDAWDKRQKNEFANDEIALKEIQAAVTVHDQSIKELAALVDQEKARVETVYKDNTFDLQAFEAETKWAKVKADLDIAREELEIKNSDVKVRRYLGQVDAKVKSLDLNNRLQMDAIKAAAQIQAQISAATMSAVNFSASVSDSSGWSKSMSSSCNKNESISA